MTGWRVGRACLFIVIPAKAGIALVQTTGSKKIARFGIFRLDEPHLPVPTG
jgi:hypothetical protein